LLNQASREIETGYRAAWLRRRRAQQLAAPYAYCDRLLQQLEEMHVRGKKFVPKAFLPELYHVLDLLPPRIGAPERFKSLIRDVLDQLFDLQELILRHRDPTRVAEVDLEIPERIGQAS
jgi:hypothetical protein